MPRIRVLPYRQGSRSARALADALGGRVLRLQGSRFRPRAGDTIINWGNTDTERRVQAHPARLIQLPNSIRNCSNKLMFFNMMREANLSDIIPEFWTRQEDIPDEAFPIVCRTVLAGHSGDGIVMAGTRGDLVDAPLYVRYVKKQDEYRVHVGNLGNGRTSIISVQRKARRQDVENPNWQVRNLAGGFVFIRGGINPPPSVIEVAQRSLSASGLDFGAVDVIWNDRQQRAYVLEINTAPGLEGQTVEDYTNFFRTL